MIIRNGKLALPYENDFLARDLKIERGKIVQIGQELKGKPEIDATGLFIFPGGIDPHVHFDEPGYTQREDFYHGSCASASGGITTVIDMPCTSIPPVTNKKNLEYKLSIIRKKSVIDFGLFGGVSGRSFEQDYEKDMYELADYVLGYKTYFVSSMKSFPPVDHYQLLQILKTAREVGRPVLLHAEDLQYISSAEQVEKKKGLSFINYYNSRPEIAEILALQAGITLAMEVGADLHFVHLSTASAAKLLSGNKRITGETAPHYLEFNIDDMKKMGSVLKTAPVVKREGNADGLWSLLKNGTIDFVASDHAPASADEKNTGNIWKDYAGIPGTATLFPYLFSEGFVKRKITLKHFLEVTSENAARRYGIFDRKGSIEIEKDADLVLVDPCQTLTVRGKDFYSKGKLTPFEGMKFNGKVVKTLVQGEVVYDYQQGILAEPGFGHFLTWKA